MDFYPAMIHGLDPLPTFPFPFSFSLQTGHVLVTSDYLLISC